MLLWRNFKRLCEPLRYVFPNGNGAAGPVSSTDEPSWLTKLHTHREAVERYTNLETLFPRMIQSRLLIPQAYETFQALGSQHEKIEWILKSVVCNDETNANKFAECFNSPIPTHRHHLGHAYIAYLLQCGSSCGKDGISSSNDIELSHVVHEKIHETMEQVVTDIDLDELCPLLYQEEVINDSEYAKFLYRNESEKVLTFFSILDTKSPIGYLELVKHLPSPDANYETYRNHNLFHVISAKCGEHKTRLKCRICSASASTPQSGMLGRTKPTELLMGEDYSQRRTRFEQYYHNSEWERVSEEVDKCLQSNIPEDKVIGYLELSLSWIFRLEKYKAMWFIHKAEIIIDMNQEINSNNAMFLKERCNYLRSLLYIYLEEYEEAEEFGKKAVVRYTEVEADDGEDKAFAEYCYATSRFLKESDSVVVMKPKIKKEVETSFRQVIAISKERDTTNILAMHSLLRLACLHLDSTYVRPGMTQNQEAISNAKACIRELDRHLVTEPNIKCQCLCLLMQSDIHRLLHKGDMAFTKASEALKMASDMAPSSPELRGAKMRLKKMS